jgi:integrase
LASIEKRGEYSYRLTASAGYDSKKKKIRKRKVIELDPGLTPKQIEKELERQALLFDEEVKRGTYLDGNQISFAEFVQRWLSSYAEKELEPKTVYRYKEMLESRILPVIGHIKLSKLQPVNLMDFYSNLAEVGIRMDTKYVITAAFQEAYKSKNMTQKKFSEASGISDKAISRAMAGKPVTRKTAEAICKALDDKMSVFFQKSGEPGRLSSNTVLHHHRLISSILQAAVDWQVLVENVAKRVKAPSVDKKIPQHYKKDQVKKLIEALASEPIKYRTMVIIDAFTGFRCGELMGLDWADVDFENRTLSVNKVSQYLPDRGTFEKDRPKNYHSIRTISIPPFVISLLKQYKAWSNEERLKCGDLWQKSDRLFTSWDGRPMFTYSLTNWFPEFLQRHNLPKLTPHGIRHTFASLLAKKIPIPELANLLGHARPSTTSDIYVHFIEDTGEQAGNMLEEMLIEKEVPQQKQG